MPPILFSLSAGIALCSSTLAFGADAASSPIPKEHEAVVTLPPVVVETPGSPGPVFNFADLTTKPLRYSTPRAPFPDSWSFAGSAEHPVFYEMLVAYVVDENGKVRNPRVVRLVLDDRMTEKQLRTALGPTASSFTTVDELRNALGAAAAERELSLLKTWMFCPGTKNGKPVAAGMGNIFLVVVGPPRDPQQSTGGGVTIAIIRELDSPLFAEKYADLLKTLHPAPTSVPK